MKRVKTLATGIFLLSQALTGAAYAASVTLTGNNVDFTFDDTLTGLFGQPQIAGDTLFFTPVNFEAKSLNGAGYAFTNDTVNITVTAHSGMLFDSVNLLERGDYLLLGSGSSADVTGQVRVFDTAMPLTDLTSSITPSSPLNMTGVPTKNWDANASVDVSAWNTATTLNVTIENLLLASTSSPESLAFVEKKFAGLSLITTPIPEAETYTMMLSGLGLIGFMVSRRKRR